MAFNVLSQGSNSAPLKDPQQVRMARRNYGRDDIPELAYANSLYVPSGRWPARGWVLVQRKDYNNFAPYGTNFSLNLSDVRTGTNQTFNNLAVVQARCVTRGVAAAPNAIYLVELTDARGVLESPWFCQPTTSQYNMIAPGYPGQYYSASTNAGVPWNWSTMVGDLWGQMATFLGTYPGLPTTPAGTPQNYSFPGESCWRAMNRILDLLGMTVSLLAPPTTPGNVIVQNGAADAYFASTTTANAGKLEDDLEWIDLGAGRVPGKVIVYFHRRNEFYGTEETVRMDALQWSSTPLYPITVPAPAMFAAAPGTDYLWDDFTVRFDVDGNPLSSDVADANVIAAATVQDYYNRVYRGTLGYMNRIYTGVLPFATGSQVDGVCWRQDYRNGIAGFVTELVRGPQPPWEMMETSDGDGY